MFPLPASLALTALFVLTSGYALLRWVTLRAGDDDRPGDPAAELAHLAMGLAMLGMVWGYGAGPVASWAQVALFTLLAAHFLARWVSARRDRDGGRAHCPTPLYHVLVCGAMVWMVLAMPVLMAASRSGAMPGHGGHEMDGMVMGGGEGAAGADTPLPASAAGAVWAVTLLTVLALVVACGFWARRVVAGPPAGARVGAVASASAGGAVPRPRTGSAPRAVRSISAAGARTTPRTDAACHLLMSLGMAVTLLLMR